MNFKKNPERLCIITINQVIFSDASTLYIAIFNQRHTYYQASQDERSIV